MRLAGVATCTGSIIRTLDDDAELFAAVPEQLDKVRRFVGIERRALAPPGVTTLDLGEAAARHLLERLGVAVESIDALIFVTQTPDHFQPSNANILHGRLGMAKGVAAFDVNQGCSGWVYGAWLAGCLLASGGCSRVLVLTGDTISQTIHPRDRTLVPLFSDACAASLFERDDDATPWWFDLYSDGSGCRAIEIPAGGHRQPPCESTEPETVDAEGNIRTARNLFMNGVEVFNFTLREEPRAIAAMLEYAGVEAGAIDAFVFHQANRFILANLAKRLKVPMEKVPCQTLFDFGNQSSASIPSVLCYDLAGRLLEQPLRLLCSGFGVGLSWASCVADVGPLGCCETFGFEGDAINIGYGSNLGCPGAGAPPAP